MPKMKQNASARVKWKRELYNPYDVMERYLVKDFENLTIKKFSPKMNSIR